MTRAVGVGIFLLLVFVLPVHANVGFGLNSTDLTGLRVDPTLGSGSPEIGISALFSTETVSLSRTGPVWDGGIGTAAVSVPFGPGSFKSGKSVGLVAAQMGTEEVVPAGALTTMPIPEPPALLLVGTGLLGLSATGKRLRRFLAARQDS